jgi:hypothetical protein
MFETPVDALYVWVALGAVSVAVLGVISGVPTTAPPDGTATAATIDEVTTSPPDSVARRSLSADQWSLFGRQLRLRNDGGRVESRLLRRAVRAQGAALTAVLRGHSPGAIFESPDTFERAILRAVSDGRSWTPAPDRLTVRRVVWEGVDVTLVG